MFENKIKLVKARFDSICVICNKQVLTNDLVFPILIKQNDKSKTQIIQLNQNDEQNDKQFVQNNQDDQHNEQNKKNKNGILKNLENIQMNEQNNDEIKLNDKYEVQISNNNEKNTVDYKNIYEPFIKDLDQQKQKGFKKRNQQSNGEQLYWAHGNCSLYLKSIPDPPDCRHWIRMGRCAMYENDMCAFSHNENNKGINSDNAGGRKTRGGKRRVVRNCFRNTTFRIFLMKNYSLEYLQSGPILDVAGGKGYLSWELLNCMGINSIVVEPRGTVFDRLNKKWVKGLFEPQRKGPLFSQWNPACEQGSSKRPTQDPLHLKIFFESAKLLQVALDQKDSQNHLEEARSYAIKQICSKQGIQCHEDCCDKDEILYDSEDDDEIFQEQIKKNEIQDGKMFQKLLQDTKLLIGMHPDQAAVEIAMFAIAQGKPWAVVPCCVYKSYFPARKLQNGEFVATYNDLVQFLMELHPKAQKTQLDFEGKNICVYVLEKDAQIMKQY